jgi:hypothetical protein
LVSTLTATVVPVARLSSELLTREIFCLFNHEPSHYVYTTTNFGRCVVFALSELSNPHISSDSVAICNLIPLLVNVPSTQSCTALGVNGISTFTATTAPALEPAGASYIPIVAAS